MEVVGLNPARRWFFSSSSICIFFHQYGVLNQVAVGSASLTLCCQSDKNGRLAVLPGAKQAQKAQIGYKRHFSQYPDHSKRVMATRN